MATEIVTPHPVPMPEPAAPAAVTEGNKPGTNSFQKRIDKLIGLNHDLARQIEELTSRVDLLAADNQHLVAGKEQLAAENRSLLADLKAAAELIHQYRVELAKARNNARSH
jgi:hypothetical protein